MLWRRGAQLILRKGCGCRTAHSLLGTHTQLAVRSSFRWQLLWDVVLLSSSAPEGGTATLTALMRQLEAGMRGMRVAAAVDRFWSAQASHHCSAMARRSINSVPGVMTLLSKVLPSPSLGSGRLMPCSLNSCRSLASIAACSSRSAAARKRLERCWFILARGATPSIAIYSTLRGLTMPTRRSMYSKMFWNTCTARDRLVAILQSPAGCAVSVPLPGMKLSLLCDLHRYDGMATTGVCALER